MMSESDTHLEEQQAPYISSVVLSTEPFLDQPENTTVFFADPAREQRLTLLHHLAPYSQVLLATGVKGVGKTTLMHKFIAKANESWRCSLVEAKENMAADELALGALSGFGLPVDSASALEDRCRELIDHCRALRQSAQIPMLIIDEAHRLTQSAFEFLLRLCDTNDREHVLSIILFGEPSVETLLEAPALSALRSRIAHKFDIPPFTEQGTQQYIHYRLQMAGVSDWSAFTNDVIHKIHVASDGVPQWINKLARGVYTESEGVKELPEPVSASALRLSRKSWLGVGIVVLLAGAVFMYTKERGGGMLGSDAEIQQTTLALQPVLPEADKKTESVTREQTSVITQVNEITQLSQEEAAKPLLDGGSPAGDTLAIEAGQNTLASTEAQANGTGAPQVVTDVPMPTSAPAINRDHLASSIVAGTGSVKREPDPENKADQAGTQDLNVTGDGGKGKPGVPSSGKSGVKTAVPGIRDAAWVAAQNPDSYTLQIMALKDELTIRGLIEKHGLQGKAAYFPKQRNGETFYVLVYGLYGSRVEAEKEGKRLPAYLRENPPWVRSLRALQSELR